MKIFKKLPKELEITYGGAISKHQQEFTSRHSYSGKVHVRNYGELSQKPLQRSGGKIFTPELSGNCSLHSRIPGWSSQATSIHAMRSLHNTVNPSPNGIYPNIGGLQVESCDFWCFKLSGQSSAPECHVSAWESTSVDTPELPFVSPYHTTILVTSN